MKRYMKKIAVCLLAVTIFTALAVHVGAANTRLADFSMTTQPGTYYSVGVARGKSDSSPAVIYIDTSSIGSSHNVRVMGCESTGVNAVNYTKYNNQIVDHVVCGEGTYYGIQNMVREKSKFSAFLSVMHTGGAGPVSGEWAPDSGQSFADPSAP